MVLIIDDRGVNHHFLYIGLENKRPAIVAGGRSGLRRR
jgi:hypothetical protein